jgi:RNA polymerase sigma-70 factor (ECF subfamily)
MEDRNRELVEDASRGEAPAIEQLLERYLPGLRRYVDRRAGRTVLAKESGSDLVQSVCRELFDDLQSERFEYRGEREFKQWLYRAAMLKLEGRWRHWRAERRDAGRELELDAGASSFAGVAASSTPSAHAMQLEDRERLQSSLALLPESYRRIIELAHVEGLSHREIAERLSITETNSRVLLSRALARLATVGARGSSSSACVIPPAGSRTSAQPRLDR